MKKRVFVLIAMSLFIVCGCGNSIKKNIVNINEQKENQMIGVYVLASVNEKDKTYTKEEIEKVKNDYRIIILDDNQAEIYLNKSRYNVTYDEYTFIIQDKNEKEIRIEYKYSKNIITINYYNGVYVFKK